jgi:hypothetical protein
MHLPKMKDSRMAQPIANFCNDQTIEHLTHHYGANLEALGTQRQYGIRKGGIEYAESVQTNSASPSYV